MSVDVKITRLPHGHGLDLPAYQSTDAAGVDLICAAPAEALIVLEPGASTGISTGIAIALPSGFEAQVRPRSGLAAKNQVTVLNAPGTIDADYRGEIKVLLINHGKVPFEITRGMRIAQMVVAPVVQAKFVAVETLDETERGAGGFGSTGT